MSVKLMKKMDRVLIWEGEATETDLLNYPTVDLSKFQYIMVKGNQTELMLLPISGSGKYNGSMIAFASSNMYVKALQISITNDHAYIEYAKEKILGGSSVTSGFSPFKIFKIFGIY